jgi:predicted nucleic acid-binding protein
VTYLVDTNVVSELRKREPHRTVISWRDSVATDELYLSVLVVGEIRQGIERLRRRDRAQAPGLERWLETLKREFEDRILPVTTAIAEAWGRLMAPQPLPTVDGLLAATALVHGLTLVTRDTTRLEETGVPLLDPWGEPPG